MDGFTEAELESARKVLRRMLGHPDPEPENTGNIVPNEGRSSGAPRITDEQYARDFVARVTGRIPAHGAELPEQDS
jgi:hypothetical protein